jgi:hypothetical protein
MFEGGDTVAVHACLMRAAFPTLLGAEFDGCIIFPEANKEDIRIILQMVYYNGR